MLKGERLGLITGLEAAGAILSLSPPAANQTERSLTAELKSSPEPGTRLPVKVYLQDRTEPLELPNALEITGPLPVIASARLSLPAGLAIAHPLRRISGGLYAERPDGRKEHRTDQYVAIGMRGWRRGTGTAAHRRTNRALEPAAAFARINCFLHSTAAYCRPDVRFRPRSTTAREGSSQPFTLAQILRIPKSDSFTVSEDPRPDGLRQYHLTGENLEMIQKIGWAENDPVNVSSSSDAAAGPGAETIAGLPVFPDPPNADADALDLVARRPAGPCDHHQGAGASRSAARRIRAAGTTQERGRGEPPAGLILPLLPEGTVAETFDGD